MNFFEGYSWPKKEKVLQETGLKYFVYDYSVHPLGQFYQFSGRSHWSTFPVTKICSDCNFIDVIVKKQRRDLPRWASFAPAEMKVLRVDFGKDPEIWE